VDPDGPLLVEGPVEVVADDGSVTVSRRFTVAVCTCRRSRTYPWCDTSHRRRQKPGSQEPEDQEPGDGTRPSPAVAAQTAAEETGPLAKGTV
jgi:CDGSH-type Zn-finger protein